MALCPLCRQRFLYEDGRHRHRVSCSVTGDTLGYVIVGPDGYEALSLPPPAPRFYRGQKYRRDASVREHEAEDQERRHATAFRCSTISAV